MSARKILAQDELEAVVKLKSALSTIQDNCMPAGFSIAIYSTIFLSGAILVNRQSGASLIEHYHSHQNG